ncbi:Acetate kinase [Frankliniella fusca]|uniref:Acetate kinase n=1 Tax=Frankliniella fusca TaxID=407009 RepID=A0AAE1L5R5_9NEOP|nr:Acetate kinase [Frankliniella fusca]
MPRLTLHIKKPPIIREETIEFDGKRETLRKVLHDIGFYVVRRDGTLYLKETPRIAAVRFSFLKLFIKYYDEGQYARKYLDETWIFEHGSGVAYIWSNGKWECQRSKVKAGGARYIIAHCGGQDSFIPGASLVYHSKNKPEPGDDYHGDMNGTIFSRYMECRVIPNTKEKSVFIMDNASYHKFQDPLTKQPTMNIAKKNIVAWLAQHGIEADESLSKKALIQMCEDEVQVEPVFPVRKLIEDAGHAVLFTPPYHYEYQPIEEVWGITKRYYDAHIDEIKKRWPDMKHSKAVLLLWEEALQTVTPQMWANVVARVEARILRDYDEQVGPFGDWSTPKPMIINLGEEDSSDDPDKPDTPDPISTTQVEPNSGQ